MNRWTKTNWRILYGSVFALCCIVLILTSLSRQQTQTPNPQSPLPITTPLPTPKDSTASANKLFDKIQQDKFHSIRISENDQYWDYEPGQQIWFSHRDAAITFSLNIPKTTTSTMEQFETIRRNIAVTTTRGEPVSFTAAIGSGDQHIIISLKGAPTTDLAISFFSPSHNESKQINVYYMKPITYTITSSTIPLIDQAFNWSSEHITMPRPIQIGEKYMINFSFSEELDRTSVNEHYQRSLPGAQWSISWIDNRSFDLTLQYEEAIKNKFVTLDATSIRTARGFQMKSEKHILLEPTTLAKYIWYDPVTRTQNHPFTADNLYSSIVPSSKNNGLLLAAFHVETEMRAEMIYELVNRKGNVLQTFLYQFDSELLNPKWNSQSEEIISIRRGSKFTELQRFDTTTLQFDSIWTVPKANGRIIGFDIDAQAGTLAIIWGIMNDKNIIHMQLEVLDGFNGKTIKHYDNLGSNTCYEGSCITDVQWLEGKKIIYPSDSGLQILDIATGQTRILHKSPSGKKLTQKIVQYAGHTWNVLVQADKGNEQWTWTSMDQEISFQTSMGISPETRLSGPYMTGAVALFYVEGKGWYRIDPKAKNARLLSTEESPTINPNFIVGEQEGKWLISTQRQPK
ncbi:hypothetical protein [Paenibacillus sp. KN14-4R]|uniref:hypothetical protein n=1 Tax=Paenibacillus sp. KN14-4R TaxID=3445773 RepID=UPI003FA0AFA3